MPFISNYAGLKSAIEDWMADDFIVGKADDFIDLAEARLNRELSSVETESTLTGVVDSREITIAALTVDRPIRTTSCAVRCRSDQLATLPPVARETRRARSSKCSLRACRSIMRRDRIEKNRRVASGNARNAAALTRALNISAP